MIAAAIAGGLAATLVMTTILPGASEPGRHGGPGCEGMELMRVEQATRPVQAPAPRPLHRRFLPVPARRPWLDGELYPGEPENCRRDARQFALTMVHLGLLVAVFKVYRIEGRAFFALGCIALAALPVHYLLPYERKKPAFLAASVVGLAWGVGLA